MRVGLVAIQEVTLQVETDKVVVTKIDLGFQKVQTSIEVEDSMEAQDQEGLVQR